MKIHIVQAQDTLSHLAKKYNVPVERIIEANSDLQQEQPLEAGSKIFIPTGKISLGKVVKESKQRQEHENHEQSFKQEKIRESSAYGWDSSTHHASSVNESSYAMRAENYYADHYNLPPMPPTPAWDLSYHMLPTNPYLQQGHISAVPMPPCYYPYPPMSPYPYDPYQQMQLSYQPPYPQDPYWAEESEQEDLWASKESSSVEG